MSLRVWLPLNGDLTNNGLSDLSFSMINSDNTTINNSGKLGKCYYNNSFTAGGLISDKELDLGTNVSMCCWFRLTSVNSSSALGGSLISQHCHSDNTGLGLTIRYASASTGYLSCSTGTGSSRTYNTYYIPTLLQIETWYHAALTYDGTTVRLYLNGVLGESFTYAQKNRSNNIGIFLWSLTNGSAYASYKLKGSLNDVRIYDHALSPKEVKELSKGLVAHYKLDDRYISDNLIINGFGELGTENWSDSTKISTTEIPSGHSEIKASFYNGNYTKEYIPINPYHSYTISGYIKSSGATTGNTYPSIYPYDIDKKFIANFNSSDGFSRTYTTTLAQPLKKGDTVIYATNLSNWTTATDNYYFYVAIFGYRDSFGNVYDDFIYTADSLSFGSKTDKSNINKTNNTITLKSAFTGEDRPAGTTICQATAGSTYYYPWGGIALSSISDWTFKTFTFVPKNTGRLKACRYLLWNTYNNCYIAGNKLTDNNEIDTTVYDCSGYNYHGTKTGTGSLTVSSDTIRYSTSTYIPVSAYITHPRCISNTDQEWTCCAWVKLDSTAQQQRLNNFNIYNNIVHSTTPLLYINSGSNDYYRYGSVALSAGVWTHIAFVFKNSADIRNVYVNGVLTNGGGPNKTSTPLGIPDIIELFGSNFAGRVSDYREYSTALSADDIKELYQTSASIDKNGNMYAYELKEV